MIKYQLLLRIKRTIFLSCVFAKYIPMLYRIISNWKLMTVLSKKNYYLN